VATAYRLPNAVDQIVHSVLQKTVELARKLDFFIAAVCSEADIVPLLCEQKYIQGRSGSNYWTDIIHVRLVLQETR
jgi:hypothetical protein